MTQKEKQAVCDAFNLLRMHGKIHPDGHYKLVDDTRLLPPNQHLTDRQAFFLALAPYMEAPAGYSPSKDYVFLWRNGPPNRPFLDAQLIEYREFILLAEPLYVGRTALQ